MSKDYWFCRFNGFLYLGIAEHDEPVMNRPHIVSSVADALDVARRFKVDVAQVGICPPDMMGLDEVRQTA